jgi:hypothetical protein
MTDKNIDNKPWTLPPLPDFKDIFVHTKEENAAQADVPLAFQLDGELSFHVLFFRILYGHKLRSMPTLMQHQKKESEH